MAKKSKNTFRTFLLVTISLLAVLDFVLLMKYFMQGKNIALLNPKGLIAQQQFDLFMFTTALLLIVALPTLAVLFYVAWRYRESNKHATYQPKRTTSKAAVFMMWLVPSMFMVFLAGVMWPTTHKLSPRKTIAHDKNKPLTIQVVSMNWKWLFLYPEQGIATVNFVQIPVDTPVTFELTADESPMSSFWIPNLGGQLYSMTTHVNRLNLLATEVGDYNGNSAEINGSGFAGMKFVARASTQKDFTAWVASVKQQPQTLSTDEYSHLLTPSEDHPVTYYSDFKENLFATIIQKYYQPLELDIKGGEGH